MIDEDAAPVVDDEFYNALLDDDPEELYDRAPCAYLSSLPDGTIVKVNQTFLTWTGFERADLVGRRRFQELLAPGDRMFYETHCAPLLQMQGHVREIAVEVVCSSGARLPALVNSVLKRDADGAPSVVRTAIFDATERRAYEQELMAARRRAEESEARVADLARTLQASFLPPSSLSVPGLDIAGAYRPAGDGSVVGGDFYDVFDTGRDTWAIVLGDVSGKGPAAAVVTSLARYTVRAEALRTPRPSDVLATLHTTLTRNHPDRFCTAVLLMVEPFDDAIRVVLSSGGHHLPVVRRADGGLGTIGTTGQLLGMLEKPRLVDDTTDLAPGDTLVLFTDGVVEARRDADFFGDERLWEVISDATGSGADAEHVADAIVAAAVDFQHGDARDDIAVVVLAVPGRT